MKSSDGIVGYLQLLLIHFVRQDRRQIGKGAFGRYLHIFCARRRADDKATRSSHAGLRI